MRLKLIMETHLRPLNTKEYFAKAMDIDEKERSGQIDKEEATARRIRLEDTRVEEIVHGVQEVYRVYNYKGRGYIHVIAGLGTNGLLCEPMIYIGECLIPITERMHDKKFLTSSERRRAIIGYVKSKDAFYTKVSPDTAIVEIRVGIDFTKLQDNPEGAIIYEDCWHQIYLMDDYEKFQDEETGQDEYEMLYVPVPRDVFESTEDIVQFDNIMENIYRHIAFSKGDKAEFIYDRVVSNKAGG